MKLGYLNLLTALVSLVGALIYLFLGNTVPGLVWLLFSLFWLAAAVYSTLKSNPLQPSPIRHVARRLSRMLLWFGIVE